MADDKMYQALMERQADLAINGPKIDQCPICGGATGRLPWQTKEGLFEQIYGYHYSCAKQADASQYLEFEKDWNKLQEIEAKKKGKLAPQAGSAGAKIQQAVRRRLEEEAGRAGHPNKRVQPSPAQKDAPATQPTAEQPASESTPVSETEEQRANKVDDELSTLKDENKEDGEKTREKE